MLRGTEFKPVFKITLHHMPHKHQIGYQLNVRNYLLQYFLIYFYKIDALSLI